MGGAWRSMGGAGSLALRGCHAMRRLRGTADCRAFVMVTRHDPNDPRAPVRRGIVR